MAEPNRKSNIILIWCLALIIAGYVGHRATRLFSNTDGSVAGSTSAQAHHSFSSPSSEVGASISSASAFTFDDLLDAIEWVESRGDPNAVGDNGAAVGAYQIHKIYVDDVNRIIKTTHLWKNIDPIQYDYEDRLSKSMSREMVSIYLCYYWEKEIWSHYQQQMDHYELPARIHNGGPDGWKKDSTKAYWLKVKARMEKVRIVEWKQK